MSNLQIVDGEFRRQFVAAYELLFQADPGELQVHKEYSATLRRVFSRKGLAIPMIGRDGGLFKILPPWRREGGVQGGEAAEVRALSLRTGLLRGHRRIGVEKRFQQHPAPRLGPSRRSSRAANWESDIVSSELKPTSHSHVVGGRPEKA